MVSNLLDELNAALDARDAALDASLADYRAGKISYEECVTRDQAAWEAYEAWWKANAVMIDFAEDVVFVEAK